MNGVLAKIVREASGNVVRVEFTKSLLNRLSNDDQAEDTLSGIVLDESSKMDPSIDLSPTYSNNIHLVGYVIKSDDPVLVDKTIDMIISSIKLAISL